jgi:hypothetical protein
MSSELLSPLMGRRISYETGASGLGYDTGSFNGPIIFVVPPSAGHINLILQEAPNGQVYRIRH